MKTAKNLIERVVNGEDPKQLLHREFARRIEEKGEIGSKWNSPDGTKEITRIGVHPSTGKDVVFISLNGSRQEQILPADELDREIHRDESNYARRLQLKKQKDDELTKKEEHDSWYGFVDHISPKNKARVISTLNKKISVHGSVDELGTHIINLIKKHYTVTLGSEGRRLSASDSSYFPEKTLTKTGLDFAEYLIKHHQK